MEKNISYRTISVLAVLGNNSGYTKELRVVSWNDGAPKLDLHEWNPNGKCCRGMTLSDEEGRILLKGLTEYFEKEVNSDEA